MLTTERTTKAATIERTINLEVCKDGSIFGTVLEVSNRKRTAQAQSKSYFLRKIAADFGTAIEVERMDGGGEVYHVHSNNGVSTCDCPAGNYKGHCRHLEMVKEAKRLGLIDVPAPKPEAPEQPGPKPASECCPYCGQLLDFCTCFECP